MDVGVVAQGFSSAHIGHNADALVDDARVPESACVMCAPLGTDAAASYPRDPNQCSSEFSPHAGARPLRKETLGTRVGGTRASA